MAEAKTTLPWLEQYPAWYLFSAFTPQGASSFKAVKPNMFKQVFPGGIDAANLDPYRRYVTEYDPYSYLTDAYPRPGGPTQAEQDLLNNSYFGSTAPLDLGGANAAAANQAAFTNFLSPLNAAAGTGGGGYGALTSDIFKALGGQMPYPTMPGAPSIPGFQMPGAPSLPQFQLPNAPSLPPFQTPDVGGLALNTWNRFAEQTPGFNESVGRALNPQIALPGQSIFEQVAAQRGQGGPLDAYVQQALGGLEQSANRRLQQQSIDLQSRFAGEGSYMSGPMMNALGELTASSNADLASIMGQLQLNAAEGESGRLFAWAQAQYQNEAQRNQLQAQIGAQTAQQMADVFGQIAAQTGSAEAAAAADAYRAQASFLSSIYGSQTGALSSAYGSNVGALASIYGAQTGAAASAYGSQNAALANIFGTQGGMYNNALNAAIQQQQFATQNATTRAKDLMDAYGMSFDQAYKLATAQQGNQQAALDALQANYYRPGANLLDVIRPFFGLGQVTTPTGGGFGDLIGGLSQGVGAAIGAGV